MAASACNFEAGGGTCQGTIVVLFRERRDPYYPLPPEFGNVLDTVDIA